MPNAGRPAVSAPATAARRERIAFALLLVAPVLFASNMIIARWVAGTLPPVAMAFWRWTLTVVLLLPIARRPLVRQRHRVLRERPRLLALGALGMGVCGAPVYIAAETTTATNIGLIYVGRDSARILLRPAADRLWWRFPPDNPNAMDRPTFLLTPGPLTTEAATRRAMDRDWGSRDGDFIALTRRLRERIAAIAGAGAEHCCVPLQGSGTFVVEAMLQTLIPRDGRLLVLVNGAYGRRILEIMRRIGRPAVPLECGEDEAVSPDAVRAALAADPAITDVALVHCETTSGILNPLAEIAAAVAASGRRLLVDAMSSFGAIAIDLRRLPSVTALAASSNKCLEGVPGIGFAVVARGAIERSAGNAVSLSLDLHAQWRGFEKNGQWRFTPPTQILAALDKALDLHAAGGGVAGRLARYAENCRTLVEGMRRLGFETLLRDDLQAPIIVTFRMPRHPAFRFADFYARLHARGFVIYPGKLTRQETFRIGCIGAIDAAVLRGAVDAVAATLRELGIAPGELYRG